MQGRDQVSEPLTVSPRLDAFDNLILRQHLLAILNGSPCPHRVRLARELVVMVMISKASA